MEIDVEKSIIYRFDDNTDLSEAVLMLGINGYFSDDKDFSDYIAGTLTGVMCYLGKTEYTFVGKNEESSDAYKYFIPEHKVVFKEETKKKTLRPFKSTKEFFYTTGFNIGDVVCINNYSYEEKTILSGFRVYTDGEFHRIDIIFGSGSRTLNELFKYYKYLKNGKWLPFGVEE